MQKGPKTPSRMPRGVRDGARRKAGTWPKPAPAPRTTSSTTR